LTKLGFIRKFRPKRFHKIGPSPDKHKSPWITVNGEDVSDSQLVIEFLAKKFGIESR
jgi:hypothetical protein